MAAKKTGVCGSKAAGQTGSKSALESEGKGVGVAIPRALPLVAGSSRAVREMGVGTGIGWVIDEF